MWRASERRAWRAALFVLIMFGGVAEATAQTAASIRYDRGQSIQPVYEGWEQNPDGTYNMWFGYLNRNWSQELTVPLGADNSFAPGELDQGQPTLFFTGAQRRQVFAFKVVLPADWPKDRDLVWTVTANGATQRAIGSLWPVWLIDDGVISANRGAMRDTDPDTVNKRPVIESAPRTMTTAANTALTITLPVTDDDMPKRRKSGELVAGGGVVVAGGKRGENDCPPTHPCSKAGADGTTPLRDSLRVTWVQWRGSGTATFDPAVARVLGPDGKQTGTSGQATTKVTFDKPGTYVLKAYADDMSLFSLGPEVTVTVTAELQTAK